MKNGMKLILFTLLIVLTALGLPQSIQTGTPTYSNRSLELRIYHHLTLPYQESYKAGEPLLIRCVWKNTGSKSITFLLKDHDDYHGTLDYPVGISAKVTDESGQILTRTGDMKEDFWSADILSSFAIKEAPGDKIKLKPGEEVTRIIPLEKILLGIDTFRDGIKPGRYIVQLSYEGILSNKMEIKVVAGK